MIKIDGLYSRDSFPEYDPKFWDELSVFAGALEERLLTEKLKQEKKGGIKKEEHYNALGFLEGEEKTIDKLIFWAMCSKLKNRHAVIDILLNDKMLEDPFLNEGKCHVIEELYCGKLFPEEQMEESNEFKISCHNMMQGEREFENNLSASQKEGFEKIINARIMATSQLTKESFDHGFQYGMRMLMGVYTDYNPPH